MEHSEAPKDHGHDGQTSTRLSSRNIRPRPGDWTCPACGFLNFRNRRICFSCSRPEPVIPRDKRDFDHVNSQSILIPTAQYGGNHYESIHRNGTHIPSPPGEWVCGNVVCGCRNFAEYIHCYRCRGQRLGTGGYFRDILVAWIAKPDLVAIIYRKFVGWLQVDIDVKQESVQAYNTPRYPGTGSGAYNTGQLYPCNSRFEEYTAEPPSPLPSQRSGTGRDVWQALYNAQPASVAQQGYSGQQAYPPQQAAYTPQWYYCGADSHLVPSHYNTIPIRHENHSTQRYSSQDLDQPLKFGCPFHKAYPHRFPCCRERSLRDTSRVKEHIYRSHLVFQCTRCGGTFPEKMAWESHQRSNPACKSVDHGPVKYAINQQQREILRSRKGLKGTSEPDRWFQIYKMVCPEAVPPYPSPYTDTKPRNDTLEEFAGFVRHEMPSLINAELDTMSNQSVIFLDDTGRQAIHRMMGKVLNNLVDRFGSSRSSPAHMVPAQSHPQDLGSLKTTVGDFNFDFDFDFDFDFNFNSNMESLEPPGFGDTQAMSEGIVDAATQAPFSLKRTLDSDLYDNLDTGLGCGKRRS